MKEPVEASVKSTRPPKELFNAGCLATAPTTVPVEGKGMMLMVVLLGKMLLMLLVQVDTDYPSRQSMLSRHGWW